MENKSDTIMLGIEGTPVECNRNELITNSDYFAAMLTGSFKESTLDYIEIQGIGLKAFNSILLTLRDHSYVMEDDELHNILEGASMLQFQSVRKMCERRIRAVLNPFNCLNIWRTAEMLQITSLWLLAKSMALEEFSTVCQLKHIFDLDLNEICTYLGNIYLNPEDETVVFQTAMNWWYKNREVFAGEDATNVIFRLLNCLDFRTLTNSDIEEMQAYPDISANEFILSVLNCVVELKTKGINVGEFPVKTLIYAIHLCNSKSRISSNLPSILVQKGENSCHKKLDTNNIVKHKKDKYQRRKLYLKITEQPTSRRPPIPRMKNSTMISYNPDIGKFVTHSMVIESTRIRDLVGFKLLSDQEFIYFFGGEMVIGSRNFNCNVWRFDSFKEEWEMIAVMPYGRRNFEAVLVGDCLFIVGGVAIYRVLQENMFWYDKNKDKWSPLVALPNQDRFFKCCPFLGHLCIVYLIGKCVYLFDKAQNSWTLITMFIDDHVVAEMRHFSLFSLGNKLYIKGKYLIILQYTGNSLILLAQMELKQVDYEEMEIALHKSTVYTFYKHRNNNYFVVFSLESLNLNTNEVKYIFQRRLEDYYGDGILSEGILYQISTHTKMLSINYYSLLRENVFVNNAIDLINT